MGTAKGIVYHKRSTARQMPKYGRKSRKGSAAMREPKTMGLQGIVENTTLLDVPVRYAPFGETKRKLLRKIL